MIEKDPLEVRVVEKPLPDWAPKTPVVLKVWFVSKEGFEDITQENAPAYTGMYRFLPDCAAEEFVEHVYSQTDRDEPPPKPERVKVLMSDNRLLEYTIKAEAIWSFYVFQADNNETE
jgi:hypothetical protein